MHSLNGKAGDSKSLALLVRIQLHLLIFNFMNKVSLFCMLAVVAIVSIACEENRPPKVERVVTTIDDGDELHEVIITTNDTAQITEHCSDCVYCQPYFPTDNPEGNPD